MDERKYKDLSVHEIKNMVSAISGYAELIARGIVKDAKAVEMAGKIHEQSKILSQFLDKKYIYELLTGGLYTVEWKLLDMGILFEETVGEKKFPMDRLRIQREPVAAVSGDTVLLKEMIGQLTDNALKYAVEESDVEVRISSEGEQIVLTVINEAEHMEQEDLEQLLEPYYRRDKSRSRKMGSQGMGLPIVSEVVKMHGGTLRLAYEEGKFRATIYLKTER